MIGSGCRFLCGIALVCSVGLVATCHADDAGVNTPALVPTLAGTPETTPEPTAPAAEQPPAEQPPAELALPPTTATPPAPAATPALDWNPESLLGGRTIAALLPSAVLFGVVTLAPAVLLMTTCFVRMSVVLALVRQGLGAAGVPSNQIVASLAIFLSAMVMWPVWTRAWNEGVAPYRTGAIPAAEAFERGSLPIRRWMATQIEQAGNRDTVLVFLARHPTGPREAATYDEVPLEVLLPAFLVSELETAFTIGLRLLVPFLVILAILAALLPALAAYRTDVAKWL